MVRSVMRDGKIIRPDRLTKVESAKSRCISTGMSGAKVRLWRLAEFKSTDDRP